MFFAPDEQHAELTALAAALVKKALENTAVGEVVLLIAPREADGSTPTLDNAVFAMSRKNCKCGSKDCRVAWMRNSADLIHDMADAEERGVPVRSVPTHLS